jgi:L-threonylcarbamoyladenylate synthase
MREQFEKDIIECIKVLKDGGLILYPTDTIWGIGCDATNKEAVQRVYNLKKREDKKSLIIFMADEKEVLKYVAAPDLAVFDYLEQQLQPTTVIFENAIGLPSNITAQDGSIAIRLPKDDFCRHLVKRFGLPVVSTSANISNNPSPQNFDTVSDEIKSGVNYIVNWRRDDKKPAQPSRIIKWNKDGTVTVIR